MKGNMNAFKESLAILKTFPRHFNAFLGRRFGVFIFVSNAIGNKYEHSETPKIALKVEIPWKMFLKRLKAL